MLLIVNLIDMIKKVVFSKLIKNQALESLEKHLIYTYLINRQLDFSKCCILTNYFNDFVRQPQLFLEVSSLEIASIKELENYLELIIPDSDRKLNGAFFTPNYITDFIVNELSPQINDKNLDPSCGCGAFLVGLTEYYQRSFNKKIKSIIKENIYGADILFYNIHRTKLILTIYALQNGEILEESDFNLYHQDSLKSDWQMQFDNIVGNPPYVKFQDLADDSRTYLLQNWATVEGGTFNLYFAFFELGYKLLKENGKLGYITPNNYFTSLAGESLRRFFQKKQCVTRIIDFSHKKVFDAQTYTAITFINKSMNEAITFDRIKEGLPENFLAKANGSLNYFKDLNPKKWRLLKSDEQKNIKIIETIGTPISKLFDICVGIATLKDEVFFINSKNEKEGFFIKNTEGGTFLIEKEITKSVYKISDFKNQGEIDNNARRIIFPYTIRDGIATPIPEGEFKVKYPNCYAYLLSEKVVLENRDKGKVKFDPFYVWGRTQGLTKTGKKILTPTFSQYPRFLIVEEEDAYFTNGYGIYFKAQSRNQSLFDTAINPLMKVENIDVTQKILNSYLMHYYVSKTSVSIEGGYPCYQKNFIEKFTIPNFSQKEIDILRGVNNKEDIDAFLIEKYQVDIYLPNLSV